MTLQAFLHIQLFPMKHLFYSFLMTSSTGDDRILQFSVLAEVYLLISLSR